jgi:Zn-finger nucleic acid-binding protein
MLCPTCHEALAGDKSLTCHSKHGFLIPSTFLVDIEEALVSDSSTPTSNTKHIIACPNCGKPMQKVDYNHTGVHIDACTNCHYRWLDAWEIHKIQNHKPQMKPEDLLFLTNFDEQVKAQGKRVEDPMNPRIPWFNWQRIIGTGNSKRTLGTLFGMSIGGMILGLLRSKFLRIVLPIMLIFITLFYFLVIRYFRT